MISYQKGEGLLMMKWQLSIWGVGKNMVTAISYWLKAMELQMTQIK